MTNVVCENNRGAYQINIEGHANYNDGPDIVCSSVSTLSFTLMCAIENKDADAKNYNYDNGDVHVYVRPTKENQKEIDTIVETIMLGFAMLAEKYPDNVTVQW